MRSSRFFAQLADSYRQEGDLDRAIEVLIRGLERNPDYITARIILARCYAERGDDGLALEEYDRILDLDPFHTSTMKEKIRLLLRMAKPEAARRCAEMYLDEVPNDEEVRSWIDAAGEQAGSAAPAYGDEELPEPKDDASADRLSSDGAVIEQPGSGENRREEGHRREDEAEEERHVTEQAAASPDSTYEEKAGNETEDDEGLDTHEVSDDVTETGTQPDGVEVEREEHVPSFSSEREASLDPENEVIATMTLAEIYASQGFYDKAIEIYQRIVTREPTNEAARIRIEELQKGGTDVTAEESARQRSPGGGSFGMPGSGAAGEIVTDEEYQKFKKWLRSLTERREERNTPGSGEEHEFGNDS